MLHSYEIITLNYVFNGIWYSVLKDVVFTFPTPNFVTGYPIATEIRNIEDKFYEVEFNNEEFIIIPFELAIATYAKVNKLPTNQEEKN